MRGILAAALPLIFGTTAGARAEAATLHVPGEFSTLSAACAAAEPGDEVLLAAGVHGPAATREEFPIRLSGAFTIRGEGADRTVLDASDSETVFVLAPDEPGDLIRIQGLTIARGRSAEAGGAVRVQGGRAAFTGVRFTANVSDRDANAVFVAAGSVTFVGCLFDANGESGATVSIRRGDLVCDQCTFAGNAGPCIDARRDATVTLRRSVVADPGTPGGPAAGLSVAAGTGLVLQDNLFDGCFDGVLRGADGPIPGAQLRDAQEEGGLRTGRVQFVDPFREDFRLVGAPDSSGLGAYGGASALADSRASRPDDREGAREAERPLLGPNVPNPGNPGTTIHFSVPVPTVVDLGVYNVLGQRVRSLISEYLAEGEHREPWDGRDDLGEELPPGIYFIRVTQGGVTESRRLVLVR